MKHVLYLILLCGWILTAGCQPVSTNAPLDTAVTSTPEPVSTFTMDIPSVGDPPQMASTHATPLDSNLEALIEKAKEDLTRRAAISTSQIQVVDTAEVEWPDSSLGCPQPGMSYLQVITPGYRIVLEANGTRYEYHSNKSTLLVFCESPNPAP